MLGILIHVLATAGLVYLLASVLPGIRLKSFGTAVLVAVVYGLLSALLYKLLALIAFLPMILTLGLFGFVIHAFLLWVTDKLIDDFEIRSLPMTLVMAVLLTIGINLIHRILL